MAKADEFALANRKGRELQASLPRALSVHYDRRLRRIVIHLSTKLILAFSPDDAEGLEDASPAELNSVEISPSGFGIYFPRLDADIYLPSLMEGFLGSRKWMASRLGAQGGRARSAAKTSASRQNGALGGRPRSKTAAAAVPNDSGRQGKSSR